MQARLVPADAAWLPSAPGVDMGAEQEFPLEGSGPAPTEARFLLLLDSLRPYTFDLLPGWNLLGMPMQPAPDAANRLLAEGMVQALWEWLPGNTFTVPERLRDKRGYWVLVPEARTIELPGTPVPDTAVRLDYGWQIVAPVAAAPSPWAVPDVYVWGWDGAARRYVPVISTDLNPTPCVPGTGYWVLAIEAGTGIWEGAR